MMSEIEARGALVHDSFVQRKHKRVDLRFKVRLFPVGGGQTDAPSEGAADALNDGGFTLNLSQGGLGLRWEKDPLDPMPVAEGDRVLAEIQVPRTDRALRCVARVVWILRDGDQHFRAGVAFEGFNKNDLIQIQDIVAAHN